MSLPKLCAGLLVLSAVAAPLRAGTIVADGKKEVVEDLFPYKKGVVEVDLNGGAFGSIGTKGSAKEPDAGYAIGELRGGLMLSAIHGHGILRGNWEVLGELFGGGMFDGPGDYLFGADVYLRYNFVQPHSKLVPYIQVGGGGVYSDAAYDDQVQHLIGSNWSFVLQSEIGVRYHIRPNLAISTAFEYRHISNADTADRNKGLNALGGTLGINWFF